jgi:hypothetical protein
LNTGKRENKLQVSETKGVFMTKSILMAVASLLVVNVAPAEPPAPSLPEGDEHVATLAHDFDQVVSASILFHRCINENRPTTETLGAANVLAANYAQLGSHLSDFYYWLKFWKKFGGKPSDFSVAAQERMQALRGRMNTELSNSIKDFENPLRKPQYKDDPRMHESAQRVTHAYNALKAQEAQADKQ